MLEDRKVALQLPTDAIVAPSLDAQNEAHAVPIDAVGGEMILDIGPQSAAAYARTTGADRDVLNNRSSLSVR